MRSILDIAEDDVLVIIRDGESTLHRVASAARSEDGYSVTLTTEQAGPAFPSLPAPAPAGS